MWSDNTIEKRVMAVIKARIQAVQKAFEDEIKLLEGTHDDTVTKLEEELKANKEAATNKHVDSILGKII